MIPSVNASPAVRADMPEVARFAAQLVRLHHALDPHRFMCLEPIEPGYERWLTSELADPDAAIVVAERTGAEPAWSATPTAAGSRATGTASSTPRGAVHDIYVVEPARQLGAGAALGRPSSRASGPWARRAWCSTPRRRTPPRSACSSGSASAAR